jgi:TonB-linked SusC/RagA family outer membrane protein
MPISKMILRKMKLTLILVAFSIVNCFASAYSQKVSLNLNNVKFSEAINEISRQTKLDFAYSKEIVDMNRTVSISAENVDLKTVLDRLLYGTQLMHVEINNKVYFGSKEFESVIQSTLLQQQHKVTGTITDASTGESIVGVNIVVEGTQIGVISNANGKFEINVPNSNSVLVFSFIGYNTEKISLNGKTILEVKMTPDIRKLGEIVVVGYGTQKKREVISAISTIDVSTTKDIPASNVTQLIEGQAPGVTAKQTTGAPGKEFEVTIRGLTSLGAGSAPLYVIDGFPVGTSVGQNLSPDDIATITILKDAASTSIYGARGSNGVVLITTKTAKAGETNITFSASTGIQNIPDSRKLKVLNGEQFLQFEQDIFMDKIRYFQNREPSLSEVPLAFRYPAQNKTSTNWFDAILNKNAPIQNYNVTLSNGKGDFHSLVSIGYNGQDGAIINTNYKNYSVRANVDGKVNNFIKMGLNVNGSYSKQNYANTEGRDNLVGSTLLMDPTAPIYNADGSYNSYIGGSNGVFGFGNPVQILKEETNNREIYDVISNGYLEFTFLKNFKFKSVGNVHFIDAASKQFYPSDLSGENSPAPQDASEYDDNFRTMNLSADQLLTYSNEFGDHHLDVLLGYTAQKELVKGLSGSGNTYPNDLTPYLNSAAIKSSGSTEYGWSMDAFFGRVNYAFKDRYLFSGTFRREGSSRFGANNKYGNFPAASVGWRISDEPFMPKLSWLSDLKLRADYGLTGNNNIGNYSSLSFMGNSNYIFGGNFASGNIVSSITNANLQWEKSGQLDLGLELSAFKNRLTFTADYYNKITSDMLLSEALPSISGFTSTLTNLGKVQNNGLEFGVSYKTRINAVGIHSNFNISFNRNKVLAINGANNVIWQDTGPDMYEDYNVSKVGQPIGMIYGYRVLGIFQTQAEIDKSPKQDGAIPGVYKYYDGNGDGVISYDTKDMVAIGNPWPKGTWGLTVGGDFKNFDLNVLLTGAYGYDIFNQLDKSTMNMDGVFNTLTESITRWRSAQNPGAGVQGTSNTWKWERESNSRYIYSGTHMWIKNVSLGYTLPKSKLFSGVRVYISGDNLLLFTKYPGFNPDVNSAGGTQPGYDDASYPLTRNFTVGVNITF